MDKYTAAAKAFWETFKDSWEAFVGHVSGKDAPLFAFLKDFISKALGIGEEAASAEEAE